jgi:hypothetical protein
MTLVGLIDDTSTALAALKTDAGYPFLDERR